MASSLLDLESLLLEDLNNGLETKQIALKYGKSEKDIWTRIQWLAYKLYVLGVPIQSIAEQTKLSEEQVLESIQAIEEGVILD
jgi:biotin operon repressor